MGFEKRAFRRIERWGAAFFIVFLFLFPACPADRGAPGRLCINVKGYADHYFNIFTTATTADGKITAAAGAFAVSFQRNDTGELLRTVPVGFRADQLLYYNQGRYLGVFLNDELQWYVETETGKRLGVKDIEVKADPPGSVPAAFDFSRRRETAPPKPDEAGFFILQHVNRAAVVAERGLLLAETKGYHRENFLGQPVPQVTALDLDKFASERRNGVCTLSPGERRCAVVEGFVGMEGLGGPIFVWDAVADDYLLTHDPRRESDFNVWYGEFGFLPDAGLLCVLEHGDRRPLIGLYAGQGGTSVHLRDVPIRVDDFWGRGIIHRGASLATIDEADGSLFRLLHASFSEKADTIDLAPIGTAVDGYYRAVDLFPRRNIAVLEAGLDKQPLASSIVLFDVKKKAIVREFAECSCARVSSDETLLAAAGRTLTLCDASSFGKIREFAVDPWMANSLFFSPDKKYLGVCTRDSRVAFYEIATGRIAVTVVFTDRGEAVAYTEDNHFTTTPGGRKFVGLYRGNEPVREDAAVDPFNRPDIVSAALKKIAVSFR